METMKFNDFCEINCDGLYDSRFPENDYKQCSGYQQLKKLVLSDIQPASIEESKRWETNPTIEELRNIPDIKYLRSLHPNLRTYVINNWDFIKTLEI